jgi:hypothetical protein
MQEDGHENGNAVCCPPPRSAHMYGRQIEMVTTALAEESLAGALHHHAPENQHSG